MPSATSRATRRVLTPPSPGRAVNDSAADVVTSGVDGFSSTRGCAGGTAMPRPSATPCASSAETLASIETTRSRIASTPTLVSSNRNAPTMWFFSVSVWLSKNRRAWVKWSANFSGLAAHLVFDHRLRERDEAAHARLERAAAAERVRLVGDATARDRLAMQAVALVVVHLRDRRIDRNLVEVRAAEARQLGVEIRMVAALQQRIVAGVDAGDHVHRAERDLLGLGEEVVGVAVEDHAADLAHRHELLGDELGRVEDVEAEAIGLFLGEDLQAQLPLGIGTRFDRFPEVPAMEVGVGAVDLDGFVPDHGVRAGDRLPVELAEARLALALTSRKVCTPKPCIIR